MLSTKIQLTILTFFIVATASAQYGVPPASMYVYNPTWINPAFTGHREGGVLSIYGSKDLINYSANGGTTTARAMFERGAPALPSSLGVQVAYDHYLSLSSLQASLLYSFRYDIDDQQALRFGTKLSYNRPYINYSGYNFGSPNDPVYISDKNIKDNVDADFGVVYQQQKLDVGITVKNILGSEYYAEPPNLRNIRQYITYLALHPIEDPEFGIHPSMALTKTSNYFFADLNLMMEIKDLMFLGATYSFAHSNTPAFSSSRNSTYWKLHGGGTLFQAIDLLLLYLPYNDIYYAERLELMARINFMKMK